MHLSSIFANGINAAHACEHSLHSCKALNTLKEEVLAQPTFCIGTGRGVCVFSTYAKYLQFTSPAEKKSSRLSVNKQEVWNAW